MHLLKVNFLLHIFHVHFYYINIFCYILSKINIILDIDYFIIILFATNGKVKNCLKIKERWTFKENPLTFVKVQKNITCEPLILSKEFETKIWLCVGYKHKVWSNQTRNLGFFNWYCLLLRMAQPNILGLPNGPIKSEVNILLFR